MIIMQTTVIVNIAQASKSFAKQSPAIKYAILKMTTSKSDIFVLPEWLRVNIFIFLKGSI